MNLFKRWVKDLGRPLWSRLRSRVSTMIRTDEELDTRFQNLETQISGLAATLKKSTSGAESISALSASVLELRQRVEEMRSHADHVADLDRQLNRAVLRPEI